MSTLDAAARWYSHALGDLRTAQAILVDPTLPPREAVFLAQQAAEKALKASITTTGSEPPWIHDLIRLRAQAPAPIAEASASIELVALSMAAAAARYPDVDDRAYDRDEALGLLADAARIVEIVAEHLHSAGYVDIDIEPA